MTRAAILGCLILTGLVGSAQAAPTGADEDHVACGGIKDASEDAPRWMRLVRALAPGHGLESVCVEMRSMYLTETGWTIWQRVITGPPAKGGKHAKWARIVESKVRIDCTERTALTLAAWMIMSDGHKSEVSTSTESPRPSPPGSPGDTVINLVCSMSPDFDQAPALPKGRVLNSAGEETELAKGFRRACPTPPAPKFIRDLDGGPGTRDVADEMTHDLYLRGGVGIWMKSHQCPGVDAAIKKAIRAL